MSEHTPGPWKLEQMLAPNGSKYWRVVSGESYVADVFRTIAQVYPASASHCKANAELIARAPQLLADLTAAQARIDGHVGHIKSLEAEVEELKAIKFQRFWNEDCWIYEGDGEDHLESLVCPVVVSPQKMMEFEKAQARIAELEQQLAARDEQHKEATNNLRTALLGVYAMRVPDHRQQGYFQVTLSPHACERIEAAIKDECAGPTQTGAEPSAGPVSQTSVDQRG